MLKKLLAALVLIFSLAGPVRAADYYLPYPGILPDHPLYWAKMIRDLVQLILATTPLAKAEKELMYADKRLGAGWALIDGGKHALGVSTLTKAEKYLSQAVADAKDSGLTESLKKAVVKHEEVLTLLKSKTADEQSPVFNQMLEELNWLKQTLGVEEQATVKIVVGEAKTALEALEQTGLKIQTKPYSFGKLVEEIDGKPNTKEKAWIYYVNNAVAKMAAEKQTVQPGDIVEWRYEKPLY